MRRTAAILLSLGIVIPAMAQAAAQKRVLVPAAQKAAPAKKAAAPTKKVVAQPAAKTAGAKKAVVRQGKRPKLAKTVRGRKAAPPARAPKPDPALIAAYVAMPATERSSRRRLAPARSTPFNKSEMFSSTTSSSNTSSKLLLPARSNVSSLR